MFDIVAIPFGFILEQIYKLVDSYGLAIILFTIFTKILIYPLTLKSKKSMREVTKLQPKIQELQKKYKDNRQKLSEETARLYQEEKINPAGSCLPTLITLPIMIGLYYVIQQPLTYLMMIDEATVYEIAKMLNVEVLSLRQSEISIAKAVFDNFDIVKEISPKLIAIDFNFLGMNLAGTPSLKEPSLLLAIPVVAAGTSFLSMNYTQKLQGTDLSQQPPALKTMMYTMPLMSGYFAFILPAGIGIYWIMGNVLMVVQESIMSVYFKKLDAKEEEELREKREREERNRKKELELKKEEQKRIAEENKNNNNKKNGKNNKNKQEKPKKDDEKQD